MSFCNQAWLWNFFVLDFLSKRWALSSLQEPISVCSFFTFELSINRGVSWSMFSSDNPYIFGLVTVAVALFLGAFAWYAYERKQQHHSTFAETLVIVGGTGNLFDRFVYGGVVDFIHFHYGAWSFPIFNVADICIVLGVFLMVLHVMFLKDFLK